MASPPGATSPPLALPRQRPTLALPGGSSVKRRKPSIASNTSSAHPLRQTSFPPERNPLDEQHQQALARFSPSQASQGSLDEFSDSEIVSAIDGTAGEDENSSRKRKRGDKRTRGRSTKPGGLRAGSASLVNGEDGTSGAARRGAPSVADNADDEDEDDEDEGAAAGGGRVPLYEGGQMSQEEYEAGRKQYAMFGSYMDRVDRQPLTAPGRDGLTYAEMRSRMDAHKHAKLKTQDVRRLVNQTLSQSVPANVVTVVSAYTKTFAGMLIAEARKVQAEWIAVEQKRADGEENPVYQRLKPTQEQVKQNTDEKESQVEQSGEGGSNEGQNGGRSSKEEATKEELNGDVKVEESSSPAQHIPETNGHLNNDPETLYPGGAGGLSSSIEECDRGPLLPDHLREALRRYKKSGKGGSVGFTGLSLEGRDVAAPRMAGRRLFR